MTATVSPRSKPEGFAPTHELMRAPLAALTLPTSPAVDVYSSASDGEPNLAWAAGSRPSDDKLVDLRRRGGGSYWINNADASDVAEAIRGTWPELAANRQFSPCERFSLCQYAFALELQTASRLVKCRALIDAGIRIGTELAAILAEQALETRDVHDAVLESGALTFRGLTDAGYAVQLAKLCGIDALSDLQQIAVGALVHDAGSRGIPHDASANPARWTDEERTLVERHPQVGYEELLALGLSRGQLMMAYQHHECADGSGSPVGITSEEIHPWAKILAVVDRFDGLTSARTYRPAADLEGALTQLESESKDRLDAEMTQCWIKSLRSR